ncbi:hypothetical protein FGO68_gene16611 [Halteria grandinella]|uniref:Uncharacterized protein n=1 Tax=Halteria grandinella TaxID=5974 RepID=A0A8J8NRS5_HALGN|nr:hypothetical protein FGO68_gene16611 [Halteria grandinella]
MVRLINPELLEYDSIATPSGIFYTGYAIDCLAFPLQLVATTYVFTWLRFKMDTSVTLTMLVILAMSFLRFLQQIILKTETQMLHYEQFNDYFPHALYEMTFDLLWVCFFYFLWEISVIETRLNSTLSKADQEFQINTSVTKRNRMMLFLSFYGVFLMFFHIYDALSPQNDSIFFFFIQAFMFLIEVSVLKTSNKMRPSPVSTPGQWPSLTSSLACTSLAPS